MMRKGLIKDSKDSWQKRYTDYNEVIKRDNWNMSQHLDCKGYNFDNRDIFQSRRDYSIYAVKYEE